MRSVKRDRFLPPSKSDATALHHHLSTVQLFREVDGAIPASYLAAFLAVAISPGCTVTEVAELIGAGRPVTSRILLALGQRSRDGSAGYDLVDSSRANADLRSVNYFLTPKGRALVDRLLNRRFLCMAY